MTPVAAKVECLCVGILVADHLCAPIDHLPEEGELVLAERLPLQIGGCAANAAVDLARLQVPAAAAGCVGDDVFGVFLKDTLARQGVDVRFVRTMPEAETSGTLIINVHGEDRRFVHTMGANGLLHPGDIDLDALLDLRVLYVGGYLLMERFEAVALGKLFQAARTRGIKTVLDVVLPGPKDYWDQLTTVLPYTDVFLPNTDEGAVLTGMPEPQRQAAMFRQAGAEIVAITCGGAGAVMLGPDLAVQSSAYRVPFVGGTGAGDAFDSGFIAGMLAGLDPIGCLTWGSALGASCVQAVGATESTFNRDELLEFLEQHPLEVKPLGTE